MSASAAVKPDPRRTNQSSASAKDPDQAQLDILDMQNRFGVSPTYDMGSQRMQIMSEYGLQAATPFAHSKSCM